MIIKAVCIGGAGTAVVVIPCMHGRAAGERSARAREEEEESGAARRAGRGRRGEKRSRKDAARVDERLGSECVLKREKSQRERTALGGVTAYAWWM